MKQIDAKKRKSIVEGLNGILADTFTLYYKTHASHWNVEGEDFKQFHDMFEAQYTQLWKALDEIAERIRALDAYAPVSMKSLLTHGDLKETGQHPDAVQMARNLVEDHEDLSQTLAKAINMAQDANDAATADLLTKRLGEHEKTAWMLRSITK
jgi:starvation-inducible DNA-binding protein